MSVAELQQRLEEPESAGAPRSSWLDVKAGNPDGNAEFISLLSLSIQRTKVKATSLGS